MNGLLVLLANEPRSYREAMAEVFRALKPLARIHVAEARELDTEVGRLLPGLVICSCATPLVRSEVPAWVELYPEHNSLATICIGGERLTVDGIGIADLLSAVDRAEDLLRT